MPELEKKSTASASILIIYAHYDEKFVKELKKDLSLLIRAEIISNWYVREINTEMDHIGDDLATASIILVLISPDFLASNYYQSDEMKRFLERHKANEARVLPILLRPVEWERTPFAMLQAFPNNQKPITTWQRRYEAYGDVIKGIRRIIEQWDGNQFPSSKEAPPSSHRVIERVGIYAPEVLCVYADSDKTLQRELSNHLEVLRLQDIISSWYVREINAEIDDIGSPLETASLILILISPDFLASDYYYSNEMKLLFERHQANKARVLPILLRPVEWERTPFAMLQAFPNNRKPIAIWHDHDKAFTNIVRGIIGVIGQWDGSQFPPLQETLPSFDKAAEEVRVYTPEVLCIYINADEALQHELLKHLDVLRLRGIISTCHVREINTETEHINSYLTASSIILVLLSPDFLVSDYYFSNEMTPLLERHKANKARVIPILLRSVDLERTPFAMLQTLPNNQKPITAWKHHDEAFHDVTKGVIGIIEQWDGSQFPPLEEPLLSFDKTAEEVKAYAPEVFCVYAGSDEAFQQELSKHLGILLNQGIISTYYARKINIEIDHVSSRLATASIVLVLLSPDFLASDYRHSNEMKRILERREANEARVIPVLLRPVDLRGTSFDRYQPLPNGGRPISTWGRRDQAFHIVAQGLKAAIKDTARSLTKASPTGLQLYHTLRKHLDYINFVAWSPGSQFLASASDDCTIRVWEVVNGTQQWIFTEHAGPVNSVAWSPDGGTLASGSDDATIKLWDSAKGVLKITLERHLNAITGISFSHDSNLLASQSADNSILIWHLDTWRPVLVIHTHPSSAKKFSKCLAFHTDGSILSAPGENNIFIYGI